jgi:formylglycine-generating enzyme required for sulfatase activity
MYWTGRAAAVMIGLALLIFADPAPSQRADAPLTAAEERNLKSGDSFRECPECPQMVVVPAGRFLMGSPDTEPKRDGDEGPQQEVTIPSPFAVGKFEVTFDEWDACLAAGGCNGYRPSDVGWGRGKRPVVIVSWDDAQAYVAWLSSKTGRPYRLLSEAEWEFAARAGSTTMYSWGSTISTDQANYDGSLPLPGTAPGEIRHQTVPVDSFAPNGFGLHSMHGNVWEWVADCYQRRYADMPEATRRTAARRDAPQCETRVFRGGSWGDGAHVLRAANRGRYEPFIRNTNGGFRVARSLSR